MTKKKLWVGVAIFAAVAVVFVVGFLLSGSEPSGLAAGEKFPAFNLKAMDGETYDDSIFAGYDVTMVNIWATYCSPCIREMPDLAALKNELPENATIIGIISDVPTLSAPTATKAAEMIAQTGAGNYLHLALTDGAFGYTLSANMSVVPTTVFVNREGVIVGNMVEGVLSKKQYARLFDELLEG